MPLSVLFWVLFLLWVVVYGAHCSGKCPAACTWGAGVLLALLVGLLGWSVFGGLVR